MNRDEVTFYSDWVRERFKYPDREVLQLAQHIADVGQGLRIGQKPEMTLAQVVSFLETFVNHFPELELKAEAKKKRSSRSDKKKRQLNIFEPKK